MKEYNLYFLLILFSSSLTFSQINIPDANFKSTLIAEGIDTNNDNEIQEFEALNVYNLNLSNKSIASLEGIQFFTNLLDLNCSNNSIKSLNIPNFFSIKKLSLNNNPIESLNCSNAVFLDFLNLEDCNLLTSWVIIAFGECKALIQENEEIKKKFS